MSYQPDQPLVSLHIPKTAGTSLRAALGRWFPDGRLKLHYQDTTTLAPPEVFDFAGPICIHGHFDAGSGFGVDRYYPQARQFMGFFREPFDRAVSHYCFMHSGPPRPPPVRSLLSRRRRGLVESPDLMAFDSWVSFLRDEEAVGRGSASRLQLPAAPSLDALKQDLATRFVFVGLTETYDKSLVALASMLGKPEEKGLHVNRTRRPRVDFEQWRGLHEKAFPEEYELYEAAVGVNSECLRRAGVGPSPRSTRTKSGVSRTIDRLSSLIQREPRGL